MTRRLWASNTKCTYQTRTRRIFTTCQMFNDWLLACQAANDVYGD